MNRKLMPLLSGAFLLAASPAFAALTVTLSPSVPSGQPLDTTVTWTATVSGGTDPNPSYEYEFTANLTGNPTLLRRGYSPANTYLWTPNAVEGAFTIGVTVKNTNPAFFQTASQNAPYAITSRLPHGVLAVVNTTNNPLVALFSATSCLVPNTMRVKFTPTNVPTGGITATQLTNSLACRATAAVPNTNSMNFYIAGMYATTTYSMHYETVDPTGTVVHTGPVLSFTTGSIPSGIALPTVTTTGTSPDTKEPIMLNSVVTIPVNGKVQSASATDLAGNVLWYTANVPPIRTEPGGNYLGTFGGGTNAYLQGFREVDLAGNTVLEMSVGAISEQLVAAGQKPITSVHHEIRRIVGATTAAPTGDFIMITNSENVSPEEVDCIFDPTTLGAQGGTCTAPVDILSDQVVILNSNLGLVWNWDETKYFDLNQPAILGETCTATAAGCEPTVAINYVTGAPFTGSFDWTHSNSAQYTNYDGNIVVSTRHHDVVYKINWANGTGDGHVMWEQGRVVFNDVNGNPLPLLTVSTNSPATIGSFDLAFPWNSHQHDANIQLIGGKPVLTLYDDGNTRVTPPAAGFGGLGAGDSRCLQYTLDETALTSHLDIDGDVGVYSLAIGSAQKLANGNLFCDSGFVNGLPAASTNPLTHATETDATNANLVYTLAETESAYRTFRMASMYLPTVY